MTQAINTYECFWRGKRLEVKAYTQLEARDTAASKWKAKKAYEVTAVLAAKGEEPVIHDGAEP